MARRKNTKRTSAPAGDALPGKQVASNMLPSGSAVARGARTINDYAKASPADASGKGQIGYNIHSMRRT